MSLAFDQLPSGPGPDAPVAASARRALASAEMRASLTAMLRRRLPAQEVDDVAQTVLCVAMAAERIPSEPEELRRWLAGIARHKVADFHRGSGRLRPTEDIDGVTAAPSYEDRDMLARLLAEPRTRRDAATFEWLVREHDGERLGDIAAEKNLPAPVVRQRVSRLRRALRSRWSGVLLLVLAATGSITARRSFSVTTIAAEPASSATELRPPTLLEAIEGEWVLDSIRPARELTSKEQRIVDLARDAVVRVRDGNVRVRGPYERSWNVIRVDGSRIALAEAKADGHAETVDLTLAGGRMTVRFRGGALVLRRATH